MLLNYSTIYKRKEMNKFLLFIVLVCVILAFSKYDNPETPFYEEQVIVGAIRWDAWSGGDITEQVERTLAPKKYHNRLPWFAEVTDDNTVRINGGSKDIMDLEIEFAATAGLDYWAFLVYGKNLESMSIGLKHYLSSQKRDQINFCVILANTLGAKDDQWPIERDRIVSLIKEPGYQTVLNGRPLVYVFASSIGSFDRFAEVKIAARKAGLNPYYVFMGWDPDEDYKIVATKGFDAVSNYAAGGEQPTFKKLVEHCETNYWHDALKSNTPYIPLVTTGWDKSPRKDNPVSWEKDAPYHKQDVFPSRATPAEIAAHLKSALDFVKAHPQICKANAVIIYAWNEYDEGGWLAPTRGQDGKPDNSRLEAIQQVLKEKKGTQ